MTINVNVVSKNVIDRFSGKDKIVAKFIKLQESEEDLSAQRIGQELLTNTLPKSIFARGFVDLCDNAFREIFENIIVYLGPKLVGESLFRKAYSSKLNNGMKKEVATTAADLIKSKDEAKKKTLIPIKAAIAVSALVIPLAEYSLSYVKNLFTLKLFKKADFNNIANLDKNKNKKEDTQTQQKVRESAKKHIKIAGAVFAGCLGFATLLATKGKKSKILNNISETILAPGSKFFKKDEKKAAFLNKYFGLDFSNKNGKLAISNGQVTACVLAGFFGYTGAAKDRGKQDYKEVLYRFPIVGFYAISGNELFKKGFNKFMEKGNRCKEIFEAQAENKKINEQRKLTGQDLIKHEMPTIHDLPEIAKKLAAKNKTSEQAEFEKLFKQKTKLVMVPVLFGFTVMGLFVAGCSRSFTQYRYNKDAKTQNNEVEKRKVQ